MAYVITTAMQKFKKVYIEISNICNLQCSFCPVVERDKKIMSLDHFRHILTQAAPLTEEVCLHLMGEPLAHPHFEEIIQICRELKCKLVITTNGILIKKYRDLLADSCIKQINFSLHSYKDNFPDRDIAPYLEDIADFSLYLSEKNPLTYINYRIWNIQNRTEHASDNQEIIQFFAKKFGILINTHVDVGHRKNKKLIHRIYLHFDSRFTWPSPQLPLIQEEGFCHGLSSQIGIHANGTVVPCCLDKEAVINLGNCLEMPLEDILNSERAQAIKTGFAQGKLAEDLCRRCPYISRFKNKSLGFN